MNAKERELARSTLVAVDAIEKLVSKRLASSIFVVDSLAEELKGVSGKLKEALTSCRYARCKKRTVRLH